jgi:hypothetical protein
MTTM